MGCVSVKADAPAEECIFHREYSLGRKLGEGAFGQVRAARLRRSTGPELVELAVKIVDVRMQDARGEPLKKIDRERVSCTQMEIQVWQAVGRHPNCVHLQASFFERRLFFMVMEKCNCSLMDKLSWMDSMTESQLLRMFTEMLRGIQHVHGVDIVHRDIKPDNFLQGGEDGKTVKLCDFGLACRITTTPLKGVCGTAPYMSPEMLQGGGYGKRTDVWSFGATAYLMVHGDFPYSPPEAPLQATPQAMKKAILNGRPAIKFMRESTEDLLFNMDLLDRATPFLQALLQRVSSMRPSATEALQHPFLSVDEHSQSKPVTNSNVDTPLAPAILKARKASCELRRPPNPIVQRKLDELLAKLQDRLGASTGAPPSLHFSENDDMAWTPSAKERTEGRILRWSSSARRSSHSGVISMDVNRSCSGASTTVPEGAATPPSTPDSELGGRLRALSL